MKRVLEDCFWMPHSIKAKLIQIDRLVDLRNALEKVPHLPEGKRSWADDKLDAVRKEIETEEGGLLDDILFFFHEQDTLIWWILELKKSKERVVMEKRYLCSESWETIAKEMGLSRNKVKELHSKALKEMKKNKCEYDMVDRFDRAVFLNALKKLQSDGQSEDQSDGQNEDENETQNNQNEEEKEYV